MLAIEYFFCINLTLMLENGADNDQKKEESEEIQKGTTQKRHSFSSHCIQSFQDRLSTS